MEDIRTLIVHSGQQLIKNVSDELEGYKDVQLWRIIKRGESFSPSNNKDYDYCIRVSADKHDKSKHRENEVDYDNKKENFKDVDIYLRSADCQVKIKMS